MEKYHYQCIYLEGDTIWHPYKSGGDMVLVFWEGTPEVARAVYLASKQAFQARVTLAECFRKIARVARSSNKELRNTRHLKG